MIRSSKTWRLVATAAAAGLVLSACGTTDDNGDSGSAGADGDCKGKIAVMGALTGSNASIVLPSVDGAKLALDQFLAENEDCDITLEEFDTTGAAEQATPAANTIVADDEFIGVLGGAFSGETDATQEIFQAGGLPMISQSATNPDLTLVDPVDVFHRVIAQDQVQGAAIATYLADVVSAKSVYVVRDDSPYGATLGGIVEDELGDAVVGTDEVATGDTEFSAQISGIKSANPDWVLYAGYTAEAAPFAKQLKDSGVDATLLMGDGVYGADFPKGAGDGAEGTIITCPCLPADQVEGTFAEDFTAAYGEPGAYAAEGFDAMNIFLQGILEGNTDRASMLEWINNYDAAGLTKQIKFDEAGDVARENVVVWAYKVEGGKIVPEQEIPLD